MSHLSLITPLRSHRRLRWLAAATLLLVAVTFGPVLLSRLAGNVGLVMLSRVLTLQNGSEDGAGGYPTLVEAERWLRVATELDGANRGAWRGLGFLLAEQGQEPDAILAWKTGGVSATEFVRRGDEGRVARRYDDALAWYLRAAQIGPEAGDAWYYAGLAYQDKTQWGEARDAFERALAAPVLEQVGLSSAYYRLGVVLFQWTTPPDIDGALAAFSTALALDQFDQRAEAADAHYKMGAICELQGLSPQQQIAEFQKAVELNPAHQWAHLKLGYVQYSLDGDVANAEREIQQAIALWPDDSSRKWPYRYLGDVYRQAGQTDQAILAYRQALQHDASDARVREDLDSLLLQTDQPTGQTGSK